MPCEMKGLRITLIGLGLVVPLLFAGCHKSPAGKTVMEKPPAQEARVKPESSTNDVALHAYGLPLTNNNPSLPQKATNSVKVPYAYPGAPILPEQREKTALEYVAPYLNREKLREREGSYSLGELKGDGNSKGVSVNLKSSWIAGGSNAPKAGLNVRLNPQTGQYEFIGGEVYLPGSGIGVSRQFDEESGESKTFLNLKKNF